LKDRVYNINPWANIPAEQLQRVNQNLFQWCKECLHVDEQHFNTCCDLWTKVRTSFHSEGYWLSGMLIHQQNSYVPHSKRCTGHREVQSRGTGQQRKILLVCLEDWRTTVPWWTCIYWCQQSGFRNNFGKGTHNSGHAEDARSILNSKWMPKLVMRMTIKYSYIVRTTIMTY
jgi:hypothetical protein